MTFVPDPTILVTYSVACFILFITPGPDMSLFLARTLAGGRAHGIAAMAGASTGCVVHTLLAALGLSALLAASATAFAALKVIGALYLAWMAWQAIRHGSALSVAVDGQKPGSLWSSFLFGVGINLSNPKVVLFFVTFLPQFVSASDPHAAGKLVFLGLYFVISTAPLAILMILTAERFIGFVKARPTLLRAIDYCFAGIFGWFAFKILTTPGGR